MLNVQVGTGSNFVGSHFWNLQDENFDEESHSDRFYCETGPNLFYVESSLEMGPIAEIEEIEETQEKIVQDVVELHEYRKFLLGNGEGFRQPSEFQFEKTVRYWADFWQTPVFPRDRFLFPPNTQFTSSYFFEQPSLDLSDSLIRVVMERMDSLKEFSLNAQVENGYGNSTLSITEYLNDELDKKSHILFLNSWDMTSEIFHVNFAKLYEMSVEKASIVVNEFEKTRETLFEKSAISGSHLYSLVSKKRDLPVGLLHAEFALEGAPVIEEAGKQSRDIHSSFKDTFKVPMAFPSDYGSSHSHICTIHTKDAKKSEFIESVLKSVKNFRSLKIKEFGSQEIDDYIAIEELLKEDLEMSAVECEQTDVY
jgi:Misato Segment II tubulin-like domain